MDGKYIVSFDIGTETTSVVFGVADTTAPMGVRVMYQESLPSKGVSHGVVVGQAEFSSVVSKLWEGVKRHVKKAGKIVVVANVGAFSYHYEEKRQTNNLPARPIDNAIIDNLRDKTLNNLYIEPTEEVRRFLDIGYSIDSGAFSTTAIGCTGERIDARYYICYVKKESIESINKSLPRSNTVANIYTSASAKGAVYIGQEEKKSVVALVDMGAGTTNIAIFSNGVLTYENTLPFGSSTITSDLVIGMGITPELAERLKCYYGLMAKEKIRSTAKNDYRYVTIKDGEKEIKIDVDKYDFIVRARAEEIAAYVGSQIMKSRLGNKISYVMLVGGGAELQGIDKIFEDQINHKVQIPQLPSVLANEMSPKLSCAYGMFVLYARENKEADLFSDQGNTESSVPLPEDEEKKPEPAQQPKLASPEEGKTKDSKNIFTRFVGKIRDFGEQMGDGPLVEEEK